LAKKKPTPAEIELQLSERRFILEAIDTGSNLLQVPLVTAFVWYYLSRTNPALGALNKAIIAAELAPIVGDIKFPEGVLLGAAMESTEDMLDILDKAGLLDKETIKEKGIELQQDTGDFIGDQIIRIIPDQKCEVWNENLRRDFDIAKNNPVKEWEASARFWIALKKIKKQGCGQPDWISDNNWKLV